MLRRDLHPIGKIQPLLIGLNPPDEVEPSEPLPISKPVVGGFALHEAFWARVIGVSEPHVVQFPPFGGGEAAVRGGAAPKVQIHWVKTAKNRHFRRNESALWRNRWVRVCRLIDTALRGVMLAEVRPAGPSYWQCQPFHAQLKPIGGMVGSPPRTPPIG